MADSGRPTAAAGNEHSVQVCATPGMHACRALANRFGASVVAVATGQPIPGSYWGAPEAGLAGNRVYIRDDTPLHSFLHELCHFICASPARRVALATDAGSPDPEECAVCYLQLLLADFIPGFGLQRALADMDAWGYSFREGSAAAWFAGDGADARGWLLVHGLIDAGGAPLWRVRSAPDAQAPPGAA